MTMGKNKKKKDKKKRLVPVTAVRITKKKKSTIIHQLHTLNKDREKILLGQSKIAESDKTIQVQEINKQIEQLGGLSAYQWVSKTAEGSHGNFNSAKWVVQQLTALGVLPSKDDMKLELLDVGALDLNYQSQKKVISATAIDLNPQNPKILKADFLEYMKGSSCVYDVVVLSLVINFIGDITKRGDMLRRAVELCRINGYLVVVLPLACVNNSRYMTHPHLEEMVASLGCLLRASHDSRRLSFKLFQRQTAVKQHRTFPKKKLCDGKTMNNFSIVLR